MRRTVLVGVEGLPHSDDALVWAAHAAEQRGAVLRLVHATGSPVLAIDVLDDESYVAEAETLLAAAAARVTEVAPRVDVETLVDRRLPAAALTDGASGVELVVVGTHRLSAAERVFAGSLAYQVAAGAPCPVVVVPGPVAPEATGVVVGVDGSADGLEAVALGAAEADRTGQALHVVHAWQEPAVYAAVDVVPVGTAEVVRDAERVALSESVAGLGEQVPGPGGARAAGARPAGDRAARGGRARAARRDRQPWAPRAGEAAARLGEPHGGAARPVPGDGRPGPPRGTLA